MLNFHYLLAPMSSKSSIGPTFMWIRGAFMHSLTLSCFGGYALIGVVGLHDTPIYHKVSIMTPTDVIMDTMR